jgi:hypothetical protein
MFPCPDPSRVARADLERSIAPNSGVVNVFARVILANAI